MWKLNGTEPMVHRKIEAGLSFDGSPMTLDLLSGHRVSGGGDLTLRLTRNPLKVVRQQTPFDWSITLKIEHGGMIEIADMYPNEAPVEGYQESVTLNAHTGPPSWVDSIQKSYYFKSRGGQIYGRMTVNICGGYEVPPTPFELEVYANPGGSRNLEYDPKKKAVVP